MKWNPVKTQNPLKPQLGHSRLSPSDYLTPITDVINHLRQKGGMLSFNLMIIAICWNLRENLKIPSKHKKFVCTKLKNILNSIFSINQKTMAALETWRLLINQGRERIFSYLSTALWKSQKSIPIFTIS